MVIVNPLVSVIIPAFNEEKRISKCIGSLLVQTYQPFEIIVIDDGSTDKTRKIVEKYHVKLLTQEHKGPGAARNYGANVAKGEILIFLDADMEFPPDFVEKMSLPIIEGIAIGTVYRYEEVANTSILGKLYGGARLERSIGQSDEKEYHFFRAIKKEIFLNVGGVDISLDYFDDSSIPKKLGKKAFIVDTKCIHYNPDTLGEIFSQEVWRDKSILKKDGLCIRYFILPSYFFITLSLPFLFFINPLTGLYFLLAWFSFISLASFNKWKKINNIWVFFIYPILLLTNGFSKIVALYYYFTDKQRTGKVI